jgi:hypothetical protein
MTTQIKSIPFGLLKTGESFSISPESWYIWAKKDLTFDYIMYNSGTFQSASEDFINAECIDGDSGFFKDTDLVYLKG